MKQTSKDKLIISWRTIDNGRCSSSRVSKQRLRTEIDSIVFKIGPVKSFGSFVVSFTLLFDS